MAGQAIQVKLAIDAGPDADDAERERLALQLKSELLESDAVESVDMPRAAVVPPGAKVADPVAWGDLILQLLAAGGALTTLINALQAWLTRHERRSITLEIGGDKLQVGGISSAEQQHLIDAWLARHSSGEAKG